MPRVLIIDDQPHVRATLLILLREKGFEVIAANDGNSGLREFANNQFDLVIVDVYLPGIDGIQVIKALRARSADLPIIAISGVMLGLSERTVLDYLAEAPGISQIVCLKKPFRASELLEAVDRATAALAWQEGSRDDEYSLH